MTSSIKKFIAVLIVFGLNAPMALPVLAQNGPPTEGSGALGTNFSGLPDTKSNCKIDFLNQGVTKLKTLIQKKETKKAAEKVGVELDKTAAYKGFDAIAVAVGHPSFTDTVILLEQISGSSKKTSEDTAKLRSKALCLDTVATLMIRTAMQHVTKSIVDWINNGFKGPDGQKSPSFISDPRSFFNTIAQAEINAFGLELKNSQNPYARSFMQSLGEALTRRFEDNARYSYNELMQGGLTGIGAGLGLTVADLQRDFTLGGWEGWLALTQVPYNNPIGSQIEFSLELNRRLRGLYQNNLEMIRDELKITGGFLGDRRCVGANGKTTNVTYQAWLRSAERNPCPTGNFRYVTPGGMIAEQIKWTETSWVRQFELADSINDSLAAIFDALTNQLFQKFAKGLFPANASYNPITVNTFGSPVSQGSSFIPPFYQNSDWFLAHPDFDITKGISQAIIDEQRTYKAKLEEQNVILPNLTKWIRQLDYCVPGPNPKWEEISTQMLSEIQDKVPPFETWFGKKGEEVFNAAIIGTATVAGFVIGGVAGAGAFSWATAPIGAAVGAAAGTVIAAFTALFGNQISDKDIRHMAADYVSKLLDIRIKSSTGNTNGQSLSSAGDVGSLLNVIYESYRSIINGTYFTPGKSYMPAITPEARVEFNNIIGYEEIQNENLKKISEMSNIINKLEEIKPEIDILVTAYQNNATDPVTNEKLKDYGAEFARLASRMVTGDDIAEVDHFTKQIKDRRDYVKDNLVGNPTKIGSCEYEMAQLKIKDPGTYDIYLGRAPYPFPVDHLYPSTHADPHGGEDGFLFYNTFFTGWGNSSGVTAGLCPNKGLPAVSVTTNPAGSIDIKHSGKLDTQDPDVNSAGGFNDQSNWIITNPNDCGSVTRQFEKILLIF